MKTNRELHDADMANDPAYRAAYEAQAEEFTFIAARMRANLTQAELAARMGTTESVVSRLERGRTKPSTQTLERFAAATGHRLLIQLVPEGQGR